MASRASTHPSANSRRQDTMDTYSQPSMDPLHTGTIRDLSLDSFTESPAHKRPNFTESPILNAQGPANTPKDSPFTLVKIDSMERASKRNSSRGRIRTRPSDMNTRPLSKLYKVTKGPVGMNTFKHSQTSTPLTSGASSSKVCNDSTVTPLRTTTPTKRPAHASESPTLSDCDDNLSAIDPHSPQSDLEQSMEIFTPISAWNLPDGMVDYYASRGVTQLFPWQVECLRLPEVLAGGNLVYSAPTSAGKTLVTDILMVKRVIDTKNKILFVQPFNSVTREKMVSLTRMLKRTHIRVDGFFGSHSPPGGLSRIDIAVCTIEKANNIVNRMIEDGSIKSIGMIVVDELHLIGDPNRGFILELMLSKLLFLQSTREDVDIQIVGMSATMPNFPSLAQWLKATPYETDFRPIPLVEMVKIGEEVKEVTSGDTKIETGPSFRDYSTMQDDNDIAYLVIESISQGHSVLLFEATRNGTESRAQNIAENIRLLGNPSHDTSIKKKLHEHLDSERIASLVNSFQSLSIQADKGLEKTIFYGVAFHHAGLTLEEKVLIEDGFKDGTLKVIVATSTLAAGVNLPARQVIITSPLGPFGHPLSVASYKQMIGRAGRMGHDTLGESILICRKGVPGDKLIARDLTTGHAASVKSCLSVIVDSDEGNSTPALNKALLEVIANKMVKTKEDIAKYLKCTFFNTQEPECISMQTIEQSLEFLKSKNIVASLEANRDIICALQLGSAINASNITISEGLDRFQSIQHAGSKFVLSSDLHLIYEIISSNLALENLKNVKPHVFINKLSNLVCKLDPDSRAVAKVLEINNDSLDVLHSKSMQGRLQGGMSASELDVHRRFYIALALSDLVNEVPLGVVCAKYDLNKGALQTLQHSSSAFAGMLATFCGRLGYHNMKILLDQFHGRLFHSVKYELLDLMRVPSMSSESAKVLHRIGLIGVQELAQASTETVELSFKTSGPQTNSNHIPSDKSVTPDISRWLARGIQYERVIKNERDVAEVLIDEARRIIEAELGVTVEAWKRTPSPSNISTSNGPHETPQVSRPTSRISVSMSNGISARTQFRPSPSVTTFLGLPVEKQSRSPAKKRSPKKSQHASFIDSQVGIGDYGNTCDDIREACDLSYRSDTAKKDLLSDFDSPVEAGRPQEDLESCLQPTAGSSFATMPRTLHCEPADNDISASPCSLPTSSRQQISFQEDENANSEMGLSSGEELEDSDIPCGQPPSSQDYFDNLTASSQSQSPVSMIIPRIDTHSYIDMSFLDDDSQDQLNESLHESEDEITFAPKDKVHANQVETVQDLSILLGHITNAKRIALYFSFKAQDVSPTKRTRPAIGSRQKATTSSEEQAVLPYLTDTLISAIIAMNGHHIVYIVNNEDVLRELTKKLISSIEPGTEIVSFDTVRLAMSFMDVFGGSVQETCSFKWFEPATALWLLDPEATDICKTTGHKIEAFLHSCPHVKDFVKRYSLFKSQPDTDVNDSGIWKRCLLTALMLPLRVELTRILKEKSMWTSFKQVEMPARITIATMQCVGFGVSVADLVKLNERCLSERQRVEKEAEALAGRHFSINSPKQVSEILYGKFKLHEKVQVAQEDAQQPDVAHSSTGTTPPKTRKGNYKTDKETLDKLRSYHPIVDKIIFARRMDAILARGIDPIRQYVRMYPAPMSMARVSGKSFPFTATGRITMDNPNLLSIAKDFEESHSDSASNAEVYSLRRVFMAKKGWTLISADYSQLELRVLAHLSQDEVLLNVFKAGGDVFKSVAAQWKKIHVTEVTDDDRQCAKMICYGIIYGMGSKTLAGRIQVSQDEAKAFIASFRESYPALDKYVKTVQEDCREHGYVTTLLGRRRLLPTIKSENAEECARAERQAVNTTIQGTAADLVKLAMNGIRREATKRNMSGRLVLQLYDELIYEVPNDEVSLFAPLIQQEMEKCSHRARLKVHLPVKMKRGDRWGQMTPLSV